MPLSASEDLLREDKTFQENNVTPSEYWTPGLLIRSPMLSFLDLAFTCKTETLGFLYNHALLILTKSLKFKNEVVHEQKFKDLVSSTCLTSSERRVLDLKSEVQRFNTHCG